MEKIEKNEIKIYGPLELPSGKKVTFRAPKGIDRVNVISMQKITSDNMASATMMTDLYIAVKGIKSYDGKETDGNYMRLYDQMSSEDSDYYVFVWHEMFGLSEEKRNKAKEAASFLLKN